MKFRPMPFGLAVFLLIAGIVLGSIFTFGMQHWNAEVSQEDCKEIQTRFASYEEIYQRRKHHKTSKIAEYAIDCVDGERYFIDGACIDENLENALKRLVADAPITMLIHPNSKTIVEFTTSYSTILAFDDTIAKLGLETTEFLILGIFLYLCALAGLYYIFYHIIRTRRRK